MKDLLTKIFNHSLRGKSHSKQQRISFANSLIELYTERNPNKPIDFGNIDYDDTSIPIEERKLIINGIESNLYAHGISDPLYNMELKAYIYKIHDYLRYQPDNFSNLLLKANTYMILSDGENVNKCLNQLIIDFKISLSSLTYLKTDIDKFYQLLRVSVSTFVLLKNASENLMETKGYFLNIQNFYTYFNSIEDYFNKLEAKISSKDIKQIRQWLFVIFSNFAWYASTYQDVKELNLYLSKKIYLFKGKETDILCTLSARAYYNDSCTYSRLAKIELAKCKLNLDKYFFNVLRLSFSLHLNTDSLCIYYFKYKNKITNNKTFEDHINILRLLVENPKYYHDILSEIHFLFTKNHINKENNRIAGFLLISSYLKLGNHQKAYKVFKLMYQKYGCSKFIEALQYINLMDSLAILLKEREIFEYLYYNFIFKPLYKGKLVATYVNFFVKMQSKISKIYNFTVLKDIYDTHMKFSSKDTSHQYILINPCTDMNNYYSPIHLYKAMLKQGIPIINLTANEINFFDNTISVGKEKPIMLSYSNDCVIGTEKHWKEDFNHWEISFEEKKIICNGVNYYQTFFETVARAQKKFTMDWNSALSQYYFILFKRRMDRNIYAYNELKKVLPENISIKFIASMYHYSPWSYYYTSFLNRNNPKKESLIQINAAYENYKADEINEKFASITALNLTLNKKSRAVAFGSSEHFTHWVKDRIDGYTLKQKEQKQITDVTIEGELKIRLEEAHRQGKKVVCVIGKLLYDLCVPYMGGTFKDMHEWAYATNQFVLERDDIFLLVKPHPHEIVYEVSNVVNESFHDWFSEDKDKIYKIGHKEIGFSDLAPYVDVFALWNGTSVIELSKDRRNILVCDDWAAKDYPIGLKQPQSKKSYFKAIVQAKRWDANSHIAIQRAKMAELYEEHLSSREFTVENIGVVRSSTNTNWNVPYLKPDKVIDEFINPTQDWEKIMNKVFEI